MELFGLFADCQFTKNNYREISTHEEEEEEEEEEEGSWRVGSVGSGLVEMC